MIHSVETSSEEGFVAIRKEGTLEIVPEATDMEIIDINDLSEKLARGRIYSSFRYFAANPALSLSSSCSAPA